jgi:hypothetical protein
MTEYLLEDFLPIVKRRKKLASLLEEMNNLEFNFNFNLDLDGAKSIFEWVLFQSSKYKMQKTIDAHCHLHDKRLLNHFEKIVQRAQLAQVTHVVACGCFEEDWKELEKCQQKLQNLKERNKETLQFVSCFGVHPWWAASKSENYLNELKKQLLRFPKASVSHVSSCFSLL